LHVTPRRKRAADTPVHVPGFLPPALGADPEMDRVELVLREHDPDGALFATVLRDTYDLLYDGGNTGRFGPDELRTTEKAHMGSLVEVKLHRAFDFADGK
jgi:hypothetical protein